jgi:hypothetical protein
MLSVSLVCILVSCEVLALAPDDDDAAAGLVRFCAALCRPSMTRRTSQDMTAERRAVPPSVQIGNQAKGKERYQPCQNNECIVACSVYALSMTIMCE